MTISAEASRPAKRRLGESPSVSETVATAKRSRLASLLFTLLRPGEAKAISVSGEAVDLLFGRRLISIRLCDVAQISLASSWHWARLELRHAAGLAVASGLRRGDANTLVDVLEAARTEWWRRTLASQIESLRSVHDRLAELRDPTKYVKAVDISELVQDAEAAAAGLAGRWPDSLSNLHEVQMLRDILEFLEAPNDARSRANAAFVANELVRSRSLFDRIETRPLTEEQRRAVVVDERCNLVIAAAGSGKTSVIVAKAGWLVRRGYRKPSELLLLAFARDARNEMEERICKRLGDATASAATIRTFHSLGMAIIGTAEGKRPALAKTAETDRALFDLLKGIVAALLAEGEVSATLLGWFQDQFAPYRSEHDFKTWGEYWDYLRRNNILSLKGDQVKSYEECEIANFLYLHGVAYEYEASYEHETATAEKRQYKPDFYLPEYGIYIEHFGLDARGRTAPFVDREKYLRGMDWKRRIHAERGTVLIETFSHECADGKLIRNLEAKLATQGVALSSVPRERVFAVLEERGQIDPFTRLLATFLQHFKGSQLSFQDLSERASASVDQRRAEAFVAVFRPVWERYEETLAQAGEIDFHDMINRAIDHVEAGRYSSPFGYILVDEFQDISLARARLLKALLDNSPGSQLFSVGDDWQAIYRFGGSDIAVMREFGDRFGEFERIDLETTFRCADRIAAIATKFVLRNPAQIRKAVKAIHKADRPAVHVGLPGEEGLSLLKEALDRIAEDVGRHDGHSEVLLLGRYRHTKPPNLRSLARQYPGLSFSYMTIHRSKGLEADYAVVLGLCSGKYGFPAEIADDPLLDLVMAAPEGQPNAEERRLLYVALTRARRQVFLLAEGGPPSVFVKELISGSYDVSVFGRPPEGDVACPRCEEGRLERRENSRDGSIFYGCVNWPYCEYIERPCPHCGTGLPVRTGRAFRCRGCGGSIEGCPACGGWLRTRMGKYGRFLGCSNWPECNYTRNLMSKRTERRQTPRATKTGPSKRR